MAKKNIFLFTGSLQELNDFAKTHGWEKQFIIADLYSVECREYGELQEYLRKKGYDGGIRLQKILYTNSVGYEAVPVKTV